MEELRIWLLFLFGIIEGVITKRSFSLNNEQRRIDNTFKVLDFLRRNISKEQINAFITLFQANNPLGVPYDEFHFRNGKTEKVWIGLPDGKPGSGDEEMNRIYIGVKYSLDFLIALAFAAALSPVMLVMLQ